MPRISLPKEILEPANSTDGDSVGVGTVGDSSAAYGDFDVEETKNEGCETSENNRTIARRSGRLSRLPSRYRDD